MQSGKVRIVIFRRDDQQNELFLQPAEGAFAKQKPVQQADLCLNKIGPEHLGAIDLWHESKVSLQRRQTLRAWTNINVSQEPHGNSPAASNQRGEAYSSQRSARQPECQLQILHPAWNPRV